MRVRRTDSKIAEQRTNNEKQIRRKTNWKYNGMFITTSSLAVIILDSFLITIERKKNQKTKTKKLIAIDDVGLDPRF